MNHDSRSCAGRRRILQALGTLAGGGLLPALSRPAWAQAYPDKPIRMLLGYPPGGSADVMARLIAEALRDGLKQTVIVENRPGASGNIASQQAARAPADGYTLLFGNPAEIVINKFTMKNMGFDPDADFVPVVQVFNIPLAMVVPAGSPFKSLEELLEAARRSPNKVNYASAGSGSPGHLAGETLALKGKAPMTHIPYKGAGPALADVIGGHVNCYMAGLTAVVPHLRSGAIRVLALSSEKRSEMMPEIPTIAELAIPGFDFTLWGGLFAPRQTPRDIVKRLNDDANAAYRRPDIAARMKAEQSEVLLNTPEQFGAFIAAQNEKYKQIIKDIGYTGA